MESAVFAWEESQVDKTSDFFMKGYRRALHGETDEIRDFIAGVLAGKKDRIKFEAEETEEE